MPPKTASPTRKSASPMMARTASSSSPTAVVAIVSAGRVLVNTMGSGSAQLGTGDRDDDPGDRVCPAVAVEPESARLDEALDLPEEALIAAADANHEGRVQLVVEPTLRQPERPPERHRDAEQHDRDPERGRHARQRDRLQERQDDDEREQRVPPAAEVLNQHPHRDRFPGGEPEQVL